jgi:hypothetical protein
MTGEKADITAYLNENLVTFSTYCELIVTAGGQKNGSSDRTGGHDRLQGLCQKIGERRESFGAGIDSEAGFGRARLQLGARKSQRLATML